MLRRRLDAAGGDASSRSESRRSQPFRPRSGVRLLIRDPRDRRHSSCDRRRRVRHLRPDLPPAGLRAPDSVRPGRPVDLARRRDQVLVGRAQLERVEPRRGLVRALARPRLDRVGRGVEELVEPLALVGLELREDVVDEPVVRRADPDAQPAERLRLELADDRTQPVVPARSAALAEAQLAERQREVIDDDQHLGQRRAVARQHLAHGETRLVHERLGLHEQQVEAAKPPADDRRRVATPPLAHPARPIRQAVQHHPADVVPGLAVLLAGIPEPDHDLVDLDRLTGRRRPPADTPNGPGTASTGRRRDGRPPRVRPRRPRSPGRR